MLYILIVSCMPNNFVSNQFTTNCGKSKAGKTPAVFPPSEIVTIELRSRKRNEFGIRFIWLSKKGWPLPNQYILINFVFTHLLLYIYIYCTFHSNRKVECPQFFNFVLILSYWYRVDWRCHEATN